MPPPPPSAIARLMRALQFGYDILPPELRLVFADHVAAWAERAKRQAIDDMGRPPPDPNTFTTHGQPRPD